MPILFTGAVGGDDDGDDKEKEEEAERERQEAIREAEERRKEKHRKMEEEREKMRQEIRDKVSRKYICFNRFVFCFLSVCTVIGFWHRWECSNDVYEINILIFRRKMCLPISPCHVVGLKHDVIPNISAN